MTDDTIIDRISDFMNPLARKRRAYCRLFAGHRTGQTADAYVVLADLKFWAGLPDSPMRKGSDGMSDPIETARIAGRQEAVLRIVAFLNLPDETFMTLTEPNDG